MSRSISERSLSPGVGSVSVLIKLLDGSGSCIVYRGPIGFATRHIWKNDAPTAILDRLKYRNEVSHAFLPQAQSVSAHSASRLSHSLTVGIALIWRSSRADEGREQIDLGARHGAHSTTSINAFHIKDSRHSVTPKLWKS